MKATRRDAPSKFATALATPTPKSKRVKPDRIKPEWLDESLPAFQLPSVAAKALELYDTKPAVLEALAPTDIKLVLKALDVRRAHFVAVASVLVSAAQSAPGSRPNPSVACAGSRLDGHE
jgi:hypothetical protein